MDWLSFFAYFAGSVVRIVLTPFGKVSGVCWSAGRAMIGCDYDIWRGRWSHNGVTEEIIPHQLAFGCRHSGLQRLATAATKNPKWKKNDSAGQTVLMYATAANEFGIV